LKWASVHRAGVAVSFDLFGTLLDVDRPTDPAAAVGRALADRGVDVPPDWPAAYAESHRSVPPGRERPLAAHVADALASRSVNISRELAARAVADAFEPAGVRTRPGAPGAVASARESGPVGVCSNCSVAGLVERALAASRLDRAAFDAVVTSVDCGWRKPDRRAFEAVADGLGVAVPDLVHVGDGPATDGGVREAGGTFVHVGDGPATLADGPEGWPC